MHVRLPQTLISMSIQKLYTNRSSFAQSARFSRPGDELKKNKKKGGGAQIGYLCLISE